MVIVLFWRNCEVENQRVYSIEWHLNKYITSRIQKAMDVKIIKIGHVFI